MKKYLLIIALITLFSNKSFSQKAGLSLIVGGDYWQSIFKNEEFFESNIRVGAFTSRYGYRIGVGYDMPIKGKFTVSTKMGYSLGGFEGFERQFTVNINQIWGSITPQYQLNRIFKLNFGCVYNLNFPKNNTPLTKHISPSNYGVSGGVSLTLDRFEVGCQYTHFINAYYDYKNLLPFLATSQKQYWNVAGVFLGYRILGKNPNNL